MKTDNLISRTVRAKAYQCYINGKTVSETANYCDTKEDRILRYFTQFNGCKTNSSENTFIRLSQIKSLEAELIRLIGTNGSQERIDELSLIVSQFCV